MNLSATNKVLYDNGKRLTGQLNKIANIPYGCQWNISGEFKQYKNIWTKITRTVWYWSEGRKETVDYIATLIEQTNTSLTDLPKGTIGIYDFDNLRDDLITALISAKVGIINLKGSYNDDELTCKNLDELKRMIELIEKNFSLR